MIFRGLRIALSIMGVAGCLLLIALWVRSYWRHDALTGPFRSKNVCLEMESAKGGLRVGLYHRAQPSWHRTSEPIGREDGGPIEYLDGRTMLINHVFRLSTAVETPERAELWMPVWLCLLMIGSFVSVFWIRWRLRNVLIAAVLIAVAVGWANYALVIR